MAVEMVRVRMPDDQVIEVRPSAARLYLARGGVLLDAPDGLPTKSAPKTEWVAAASRLGVPDADQLTKDELVDTLTPDTEES